MQTIGLSEIQKNIGFLSDLKESIRIVDKKRNISLATIILTNKKRSVMSIGGVFKSKIKQDKSNIDFEIARKEAKNLYFKDKYAKN